MLAKKILFKLFIPYLQEKNDISKGKGWTVLKWVWSTIIYWTNFSQKWYWL